MSMVKDSSTRNSIAITFMYTSYTVIPFVSIESHHANSLLAAKQLSASSFAQNISSSSVPVCPPRTAGAAGQSSRPLCSSFFRCSISSLLTDSWK